MGIKKREENFHKKTKQKTFQQRATFFLSSNFGLQLFSSASKSFRSCFFLPFHQLASFGHACAHGGIAIRESFLFPFQHWTQRPRRKETVKKKDLLNCLCALFVFFLPIAFRFWRSQPTANCTLVNYSLPLYHGGFFLGVFLPFGTAKRKKKNKNKTRKARRLF